MPWNILDSLLFVPFVVRIHTLPLVPLSVSPYLCRAKLCMGEGWTGQRGGQTRGWWRPSSCCRGWQALCRGKVTGSRSLDWSLSKTHAVGGVLYLLEVTDKHGNVM